MPGEEDWVERERRTSALLRACHTSFIGERKPTVEELYALCRLTWITKDRKRRAANNIGSVVAPALSTLLGVELRARTPADLARELRQKGASDAVSRLAAGPVGFTNFYPGFRRTARTWVSANVQVVAEIARRVATGRTDEVRGAYADLEKLPPLPRPRAGDMPAFNLLTPMLACLDPTGRAPIINRAVRPLLRRLDLTSAPLVEQYQGSATSLERRASKTRSRSTPRTTISSTRH